MRILLVGNMVGSCLALAAIKAAAENDDEIKRMIPEGIEVQTLLANAKEFVGSRAKVQEKVSWANFVLCGMAMTLELAAEEIFAANVAMENDIPHGFFSEIRRGWMRDWFAPYVRKAAILFVVDEKDVAEAKSSFCNATIVLSGHPAWEEFADIKKLDSKEIRARLNIKPAEKLIVYPGTKVLVNNIACCSGVIEAVAMLRREEIPAVIVFSQHPGDLNSIERYADLGRLSKSNVLVKIVDQKEMPTNVILAGADMLVSSIQNSTTIGAAYLRIPAIHFMTPMGYGVMREQVGGSEEIEQCLVGASLLVEKDPSALATAIKSLWVDLSEQRISQEAAYSEPPEKGSVARNMFAKGISKIVR